jgi:Zn-dependent peptidase ImmA (M78 family)/transcriptional regulator with XRE-family HTH domain
MRVEIKPSLLRWARERAGFSLDVLSRRFPKLDAWERGEKQPTLKQLEAFAKATHTPIGYLFLTDPPEEKVPIPDFRTFADKALRQPSPDLLDTLYLCQQRQDWYREFLLFEGEKPLPFVGSARVGDDVIRVARSMREVLSFDLEERRAIPEWTAALRRFVGQADDAGVLVMVSGVVGSNNQRKLDPREFRGLALSDELAPLVFVNGADTKAAQMFTLAHELTHIWIGQSALSDVEISLAPTLKVERWCNHVAAEFLVPMEVLKEELDHHAELHTELERLARRFKVSKLVILRRMHDAGALSAEDYREAYAQEIKQLRETAKGTGGDFYLTLGARVGKRFARALVVSTMEGRSSFSEALRLLNFRKMSTFNELGRSLGVVL